MMKMKSRPAAWAAAFVFSALSWPAPAAVPASTVLTVMIENVSSKGGCVQVALYDQASYDGHNQAPVATATVEARAPVTIATLPNLRPGLYAVKTFQDFDRSGAFLTNSLGLPEEPFGFSNDARPLIDQPSFDAAKFSVASGSNRIVVHLRSLL